MFAAATLLCLAQAVDARSDLRPLKSVPTVSRSYDWVMQGSVVDVAPMNGDYTGWWYLTLRRSIPEHPGGEEYLSLFCEPAQARYCSVLRLGDKIVGAGRIRSNEPLSDSRLLIRWIGLRR